MNGRLGWLEKVVGSFRWNAPPWLQSLNRLRRERPVVFVGWLLLLLLLSIGTFVLARYLLHRPGPVLVQALIEPPGLTPNVEDAAPPHLVVDFAYDFSQLQPEQVRPDGDPSVARLDLVDKVLTGGIRLSPAFPGEWRWQGDRTLVFTPSQDWPAQTAFTIQLDQTIFAPNTRLKSPSWSFVTEPFAIELQNFEFYQDPQDRSVRKAVATLAFSHAVAAKSLEQHLTLGMRPSGATAEVAPEAVAFSVSYDRNRREAYVHSTPLTLPEQPNYLQLEVGPGVLPAGGGPASTETLSQQLLIPDRGSFFKVLRANLEIVRNEQAEPQQILSLQFSDDMDEQLLLENLALYLLPERNRQRHSDYWQSPREVTETVLREAEPVSCQLIPNERGFAQLYHFVVDVPPGRYLYLRLPAGLVSESRFVLSTLYDTLLRAPDYPKDLSIRGDGSMLSLGGEHRLSLLTRGLVALQVKVGRLLPGQINHLVSQTSGDIKDPYFNNYRFALKPQPPQTANYASLDLSDYLSAEKNPDRFGLFFVQVAGWDPRHEREIYGVGDKRLILITDLGLLVKNNADQSQDLFVQSIASGMPVAGARVELLGRNGVPLLTRMTAADGHVPFPSTQSFKEEQAPTVYVVHKGADTSFIPFERSSRRLNYSRYEVGGISSRLGEQDSLNAFLFSDRGIYRPGEEVRIGGIVKERQFGDVAGIPFEFAITGPRGNELVARRFKLPELGLFEQSFATDPTADTGSYQLALYLVRDDNYRGRLLGSASFRVEEFQPDSLKIESTLLEVQPQGWTSAASLQARVRLHNLFGTPAQGRK
ncbi:MAG: MG2 domain-containing protein, partial [Desulfuromonadaceae bacterium]